ncbi:MAG: beta-N-acetylhexosaminidase [Acidobacteriota bacterium]
MGHRVLGMGLTGPVLTELERGILRESPPAAVVLFGRNIQDREQLLELVSEIKAQSDVPPLVMIDEEGGRVDRLRDLIPGLPSAQFFSEGGHAEELAEWFGTIVGRALRYFDIDVNLAPVVDIHRDDSAKGLERRCFGDDAPTVIRLAGAFMRGQQSVGVASCLKHFPGLGLATDDTHYGSTVIDVSKDRLLGEDLVPYIALANDAGAVMIGHGIYPQLDAGLPATLSRVIATDLLRASVGFRGVAFSDDMEMHAVSDLGSYPDISLRALRAGNDLIMICSHVEIISEVMDHLERCASEKTEVGVRLREAVGRVEDFRGHCAALGASARVEAGAFDDLLEEVEEFHRASDRSRSEETDGSGDSHFDRRREPRSGGTGRTGREEWT